ncbi:hypothetical protein HanRHA438_Chr11g0509251 [Helianthus annuus]|nr:hypothetical protein HanRHA438_Chr11g0509251 [Helianthus annuus]
MLLPLAKPIGNNQNREVITSPPSRGEEEARYQPTQETKERKATYSCSPSQTPHQERATS